MNQLNKKAILLVNLLFCQAFLVVFSGLWRFNDTIYQKGLNHTFFSKLLLVIGVVITILAIFLVNEIIRLTQKERQAEVASVRLAENQELIDALRVQRHDFLNHLQVISGLVQLKKYDRVSEYIKGVTGEMGVAAKISNIKRPEIAALLMKKVNEGHQKGIELSFEIDSLMEALTIPPLELVKITGNLIENALQAVERLSMEERKINFSIQEDENSYIIEVNNPGLLSSELREKIFSKGFSTKQGSGRGYGLYIIKTLVEKYKGEISVDSNEQKGITFLIKLPKEAGVTLEASRQVP